MDFVEFGRTGLRVSVAALGCGGNSRLGQRRGLSEADSVRLVRTCMDLGVNFIDTAAAYGTETIVGKALSGVPRDSVVVATKATIRSGGKPHTAADVVASLEQSLQRLDLDHVDVFQLHGVRPQDYDRAVAEIVPALRDEQRKGKFRFLGITETPPNDPGQEMLQRAVRDEHFDAMMVGYSMMNQKARERVFPEAAARGIGTMAMFVVRNLFSVPGRLQETMRQLYAEGRVPAGLADAENPLAFLLDEGGADSVVDAAYRYARHTPGLDVVLFGTGDPEHARANVASILEPPLPPATVARLSDLFGALEGVGLDLPSGVRG